LYLFSIDAGLGYHILRYVTLLVCARITFHIYVNTLVYAEKAELFFLLSDFGLI